MQRRTLVAAAAAGALLASKVTLAAVKPEPFPVKGKVTVVDFGAVWCASCPEMARRMQALQKEFGDKAAFVVVDIDQYPDVTDKYMIEQLPSQLFYDAKGELIWRHTGSVEIDVLRERAQMLIDRPQE